LLLFICCSGVSLNAASGHSYLGRCNLPSLGDHSQAGLAQVEIRNDVSLQPIHHFHSVPVFTTSVHKRNWVSCSGWQVNVTVYNFHESAMKIVFLCTFVFPDYILFLAESTGLRDAVAVCSARLRLHSFKSLPELLSDIST